MKRCTFAFVKEKAILSCLVLCMAMAVLGKKEPSGKFKTAVAALQRNATRDLTDKSGLTVPLFHPLSVKSKARPINLSGLADIQAYVHPTNKKDHGNRRMQFACDTEKIAFYSCFYDPTCEGCYDGFISEALEQSKYCGEIEGRLCRIHSKCSTCGCEYQADPYFQCLLNDIGCEGVAVNCTDTTCEAEIFSLSECEDQLNPDSTCNPCVMAAVSALYPTEDTPDYCLDIQSTVCGNATTCGCEVCTDQVVANYACWFADSCGDFACPNEVRTNLAGLWALVAIPLIAIIVYLLIRKKQKPDDHPLNSKTPRTASVSSDEDYIYGRQHVAVPRADSHYSGERSASERVRSHEDHHHVSFGEVITGLGRINNPPQVFPASPERRTPGYVPQTKDQCRTVADVEATPVAVIFDVVDDVVPRSRDPSGVRND